jgi:hypothetical protein
VFTFPKGYFPDRPRSTPPVGGVVAEVESSSSRDVDPRLDRPAAGLKFTLSRGLVVKGRAVDPDGKPVAGARVRPLDVGFLLDGSADGGESALPRTDADGRFEVSGLDPAGEHDVEIVQRDRKLGARVMVPGPDRVNPAVVDVTLRPLGSFRGRVLDGDGKALRAPTVKLQALSRGVQSIGAEVATLDATGPDGSFTLVGVVADSPYLVSVSAEGHSASNTATLTLEAGEEGTLPDFRLVVTDREVEGAVVDPRGKGVAGVSVGFDVGSNNGVQINGMSYTQTDENGRFHLENLPRGTITLMAYRQPPPGENRITNLVRAEVEADKKDVQIVLPDPE